MPAKEQPQKGSCADQPSQAVGITQVETAVKAAVEAVVAETAEVAG